MANQQIGSLPERVFLRGWQQSSSHEGLAVFGNDIQQNPSPEVIRFNPDSLVQQNGHVHITSATVVGFRSAPATILIYTATGNGWATFERPAKETSSAK